MFSLYVSAPAGETYLIPYKDEPEAFLEWTEAMWGRTQFAFASHKFTAMDKVLTLSTCTGSGDQRTIVQAFCVADQRVNYHRSCT